RRAGRRGDARWSAGTGRSLRGAVGARVHRSRRRGGRHDRRMDPEAAASVTAFAGRSTALRPPAIMAGLQVGPSPKELSMRRALAAAFFLAASSAQAACPDAAAIARFVADYRTMTPARS